jgi:peptide chain release factor 2
VRDTQPNHGREGAREPAPAIHDPAAGVEQRKIDAARNSDDQGGIRVADRDADGPQRQNDLPTGAKSADESNSRAEPREHTAIRPNGLEQPVRFVRDLLASGIQFRGRHVSIPGGTESGGRIGDDQQHDGGAEAADDVNPEDGRGVADEWTDEVASPEGTTERRQGTCADPLRHEARHERVTGESEDRGGKTHQKDADAEHKGIRREGRDREPNYRDEGAADHCSALADPSDQPAARDVPEHLADHDHGCDETRDRERRAEAVGDRRNDGDDGALAGRKQQRGKERGECDRPPLEREFVGAHRYPIVPAVRGEPARSPTGRLDADMDELDFSADIAALRSTFADIRSVIGVERLQADIASLSEQAGVPDLWDDTDKAQKITSALSHRQSELARIDSIQLRLDDLEVMVELANSEADAEAAAEARAELASIQELLGDLEVQTLLNGEFDDHPAVITIRAGAGGVDASDFADMLFRMYVRWAEQHKYAVTIMDTSYAEEAGIKSATFEVDAPYAFGTLSVEAGTHRLVRMSPFNSAGKRQTSFAAVEVIPLIEAAGEIDIPEGDIRVDVFRSSGPGGQSVNTTDSAVRLTHIPTGTVVSMQNEKSQIQNRAAALRVLQSRLLLLQREQEAAQKKELAGVITASWGDQIRSYVLAPYQMVKDLRTEYEVNNPTDVFDGNLDGFINAGIKWRKSAKE